ncbi:MAG: hypothetical protein ACM3WV_06450 [Bacillota bacterium]
MKILRLLYLVICIFGLTAAACAAENEPLRADLEVLSFEVSEAYTTKTFAGNTTGKKFLVFKMKVTNNDQTEHLIYRNDFIIRTPKNIKYEPLLPISDNCFTLYEILKPAQHVEKLLLYEVENNMNQFLLVITSTDLMTGKYVYFEFAFK